MAFSPPVVGCLVKKRLQKGGSRAPQDPPLATPLEYLPIIWDASLSSIFLLNLFAVLLPRDEGKVKEEYPYGNQGGSHSWAPKQDIK